jgi:hypothetical protein
MQSIGQMYNLDVNNSGLLDRIKRDQIEY